MNDYDKTVVEYRESLEKTRKIIVSLVLKLESVIEESDNDCSQWNQICGEKENVVSVLTKLTGLLVKVVPMEKQLLDSIKEGQKNNVQRIISSDDKEIIKRFIKKYKMEND